MDYSLLEALSSFLDAKTYERIVNAVNQIKQKNSFSNKVYNNFLKTTFELLVYYSERSDSIDTYRMFEEIIIDLIEKYGSLLVKLNTKNVVNIIEFVGLTKVYKLDTRKKGLYIAYCLNRENENDLDISIYGGQIIAEDFDAVENFNAEGFLKYIELFETTGYKQVAYALDTDLSNDILNYDLLYRYLNFKMSAINLLSPIFTKDDFERLENIKVLKNSDCYDELIGDYVEYMFYNSQEEKISESVKYFLDLISDYVVKLNTGEESKSKIIEFKKNN